MSAGALLAGVVEQPLRDVLPDRVVAIRSYTHERCQQSKDPEGRDSKFTRDDGAPGGMASRAPPG